MTILYHSYAMRYSGNTGSHNLGFPKTSTEESLRLVIYSLLRLHMDQRTNSIGPLGPWWSYSASRPFGGAKAWFRSKSCKWLATGARDIIWYNGIYTTGTLYIPLIQLRIWDELCQYSIDSISCSLWHQQKRTMQQFRIIRSWGTE